MINRFKRRRELLMHRLSTACEEEDEEDQEYYKRRLRALDIEEKVFYAIDLLQPNDNKFRTYYKDKYLKNEEGLRQRELGIKKQKQEKEEYWKQWKNSVHRDAAKKICQKT